MEAPSPPDQSSRDTGIGMESTQGSPEQQFRNNIDSDSDQEDLDDDATFDQIFGDDNNFEVRGAHMTLIKKSSGYMYKVHIWVIWLCEAKKVK